MPCNRPFSIAFSKASFEKAAATSLIFFQQHHHKKWNVPQNIDQNNPCDL
ncbi:MAG: hypothetical protein ACI9EW_003219 [Cellvibrionaceae bacterium]|jgi:hypothetical protein